MQKVSKQVSFGCCIKTQKLRNMSSSGRSHGGSLFTNKEQEKVGFIRMYFKRMPHIPALFMTSVIQLGRKWWHSLAVFSRNSNVDF